MTKCVIITADDFGPVPSINEGITEAVLAHRINSVAVLTNVGENGIIAAQRTRELMEKAQETFTDLDIGVHLTISSGKPLLENTAKLTGLCDKKGNFKSYKELDRSSIDYPQALVQLKHELQAQIDVLKNAGIEPKHLSCHHNTLLCFDSLMEIYVDLAKTNKLPMRSVVIEPSFRNNLYTNVILSLALHGDNNRFEIAEMQRLMRKIKERFNFYSLGVVKTPDYVDSDFYGPIPSARIFGRDIAKKCVLRKRRMDDIFERFVNSQESVMEFMVHLRKGEVSFWRSYRNEVKDADYTGIDHRYFDSRVIEFQTLMDNNIPALLHQRALGFTSWNSL